MTAETELLGDEADGPRTVRILQPAARPQRAAIEDLAHHTPGGIEPPIQPRANPGPTRPAVLGPILVRVVLRMNHDLLSLPDHPGRRMVAGAPIHGEYGRSGCLRAISARQSGHGLPRWLSRLERLRLRKR